MIPDIGAAMNARLGAWADGQKIPLFIENSPGDKPAGIFLESFDMPATPQTLDLGLTCHIYPGIFQVNVVVPVGSGTSTGRALARQVAALFPEGQSVQGDGFACWISSQPSIYAGVLNPRNTRYSIPVSIPYRADISS
ncbi:phage tail terminator-like protein [Cronobacter sakazakii]|uniref:tail terminator n=1 Tax=Cronobacter phage phiES15 TaxID=1168280 RepID=UPI00025F686D|nr:phage tail terminator-like protein [Cronobacter sakazakii]YP_006590043.1 tail terminator [Cronobacter phage phiES15]AFH14960.1 hypothetical protein phiES15_038 [Cronobacter phage phiES15]AFJ98468.1 hypothetical protein ES15_0895 [Cronobacter sakazakii ES15]